MMTVRFPNGLSMQYNDANFAQRSQFGYTDIYTKKGGTWVAQVPTAACVVERVQPCRIYNSGASRETASNFLAALRDEAQSSAMSTDDLAAIKRALESFDARRRLWK